MTTVQTQSAPAVAAPLSRTHKMLLWARLLVRLERGEALLTDDQFEQAMAEEYARLTGAEADASVRRSLRRGIAAVNRAYPQTYRAFGLQNGLNQAFENSARRLKWDARRIEENGVRSVNRFGQKAPVRALLRVLRAPVRFNPFACVNRTLQQLDLDATAATRTREAADRAAPLAALDPALLPDLREAVSTGLVDTEETTCRLQEQQQARQQIEAREMEAVPQRLDVYVDQGLLTATDALHFRALRDIEEQERFREISRREAAEMRAQVLSREGRKELEEKVKVAVSLAVNYLEIFEALRRIDPKYDEALRFLVQHKHFVAAAEVSSDEDLVLTALQYNPDLAERICDIMERRPQEIRFLAVRLPPYKGVIGPQMERIGHWTIEEHFIDDLRTLNSGQMSQRLNDEDGDLRVRVAADICCLVHLIDHVIRPTEFRRQLRLLEFGKLLAQLRPSLEKLYQSAHDFEAGRRRAEMYVHRNARRAFNDPTGRELASFDRAAEVFLLEVEMDLHEEEPAPSPDTPDSPTGKGPKRGWDPDKRPVSEKSRGRTRVVSDASHPDGFVVEHLDAGPPRVAKTEAAAAAPGGAQATPSSGGDASSDDRAIGPLEDVVPSGSAAPGKSGTAAGPGPDKAAASIQKAAAAAPDDGEDEKGPVPERSGAEEAAVAPSKEEQAAVSARGATAAAGGRSPRRGPLPPRQGNPEIQIARIEVRVGGSYREIRAKIMPDPEAPHQYVIAGRDPRSGELVPQTLRGTKRIVEKNRRGVWQIAAGADTEA